MQVSKTEFQEFYSTHINDVYRYAYFKTSNQETAEDVTSEAFLRMLSSDKWAEIQNKKAWVLGIARNIVYETYREKAKPVDSDQGELDSTPEQDYSPETEAVEDGLIELVKSKVSELDELTREIIVLRVWEELKFAEIAEVVELKKSATKLRYYRGIEQLKQSLDEDTGTKARSVGIPIILGALLLGKQSVTYNPAAEFASTLTNLLNTQIMDRIKSDPVPKLAEGTDKASEAASKAAEASTKAVESTASAASNAASGSSMFGGLQMGSLSTLTTGAFATKAFIYGIAAVAVVGVTSIAVSDNVATNLRDQPVPQVARIDAVLMDDDLVEVEVDEDGEAVESDEDIIIDTSDWATYKDDNYGIEFRHPADMEVTFAGGLQQAGFYVNDAGVSLLVKFFDGQLAYYNNESATDPVNPLTIERNGDTIELSQFGFGEGYPDGFDENGNPTCVSGGGFIDNYAELDGVLAIVRKSFSTTDCNEDNELIRTETDPETIEIGRLIVESFKKYQPQTLADLTKGWKTFKGGGFTFKRPARFTNANKGYNFFGYKIDDTDERYFHDASTIGTNPAATPHVLLVYTEFINAESLNVYQDYIGTGTCPAADTSQCSGPNALWQPNTFSYVNFRDVQYLKMGFWNAQNGEYNYAYAGMVAPGYFVIFVEPSNNLDEFETILATLEVDSGYVRGEQTILDYTMKVNESWDLDIVDDGFRYFTLTKDLTTLTIGKAYQIGGFGFGPSDIYKRDVTLNIAGSDYEASEETIAGCSDLGDGSQPNCIADGKLSDIDGSRTDVRLMLIIVQTDMVQDDPNGPVTIQIQTPIPDDMTYDEFRQSYLDDYWQYLEDINSMLSTLRLK